MTERPKVKLNKKEIQQKRSEIIAERSKRLRPLKKEIERLENIISKNEELIALKTPLLVTASEESDADKINSLSKDLAYCESAIEEAFDKLDQSQTMFDEENQGFAQQLEDLL